MFERNNEYENYVVHILKQMFFKSFDETIKNLSKRFEVHPTASTAHNECSEYVDECTELRLKHGYVLHIVESAANSVELRFGLADGDNTYPNYVIVISWRCCENE